MSTTALSRGDYWFSLLTQDATHCQGVIPSVKVADTQLDGHAVRYIAIVPDPKNHFPRSRQGEMGLIEGWSVAKVVNELIQRDAKQKVKSSIVLIIDIPSQTYGRREEAFGIHQALAGAVAAYCNARLAGHPIIGLIVGKAMSGAFLAHGYQANRLFAFNDAGVMIHAMGKESAARITLRTVAALEKLAATIPPMAYDIKNYNTLGLLDQLLEVSNPMQATSEEIARIKLVIAQGIASCRAQENHCYNRLGAKNRSSSSLVREKMLSEWSMN